MKWYVNGINGASEFESQNSYTQNYIPSELHFLKILLLFCQQFGFSEE